MKDKNVLSGNAAIARGFFEGGGTVASSFPGSPTVEIMHVLNTEYDGIYSEFSVNEKVALEIGIGASFAGARTLVSMKHVGMNICADPLMTFTQTRINGGFVLVSGDDPGMLSSQNEQDNRIFGKFAHMPILDPSDSQEAKDFVKYGLEMSEKFNAPFMLRITSRLCHSRSIVKLEERQEHEFTGFSKKLEDYGMIPPNTFRKQYDMKERIEKLSDYAEEWEINYLDKRTGRGVLLIASGIIYENLKELDLDIDIFKLGMIYPLPVKKLQKLSNKYERIIVIEEMMPFIENELKINGIDCRGKEYFSFTGELNTEDIEKGLYDAGVIKDIGIAEEVSEETVARIPMFCAGCPHRPVFDILKKAKASVIGDIGCYSMAVLPPLNILNSIISMGASIGIMKGMSKAYSVAGENEPLVAVIGDGTFYHSGMPSMLNMLHQLDPDYNMTLLVLDNGTTAMTGGQTNAGTGRFGDGYDMNVSIENLIRTMGFDRIRVVDQFEYKEASEIIKEELKHQGLSIVITTRPCALNFRIRETPFRVDPDICIGCRSCVRTNCPPIAMKKYEGIEKLKSSINPDLCVGCSVCAQVCPVNAIKRMEDGDE
ncbi:indolepyruvate ferredoxin oxidoreductase alpha subunit [Dethiosulfatibacter aminovorans DSM 17477]|uniref:Indolepyruvate oxidoreductase subunit IorA n=1 Tax=Dethiosulfatibacter aminovorans DSM 17477 TaxID=1121476 RepID=A0A1M6JH08_9FIRM|nr:thiamine pyrophosphate-dependent enzyme [Dethiosulfatibacter aminovorans]SHJ45966.1 indolepyruvate ferredoxin oxidoreductase alpha subunit [Dethiosulfatibacter aminovorans DSM 17477]